MKLLIVLIILFLTTVLYAQNNPFSGSTSKTTQNNMIERQHRKAKTISETIWQNLPFSRELLTYQRQLTSKFSDCFRSIKEKPDLFSIGGLLFLAFIYGIIHSIGPGHAKLLFASHTLAHPTSIYNIFKAGFLFSLTHIGISVLLFFILKLVLGIGQTSIEQYTPKMIKASGILIILAGLFTMFSPRLEKLTETSLKKRLLNKATSIGTVAFSAGLAPCPGAFLLLVFSNLIGIVHIGVLAVASVSLGMALMVSLAGAAGGLTAKKINSNKKFAIYTSSFFRYAGSSLILLTGILMVLS